MRRTTIVLLLLALTLVWAAVPARAGRLAPELLSSDPADGEKVHEAPEQVVLRFSEPLDQSSTATVAACGRPVDEGDAEVSGMEMTIGIAKAYAARYTVVYRAVGLGGVTGTTEGSISFEVHMGADCDGGSEGHGRHEGSGGEGTGGRGHGDDGSGEGHGGSATHGGGSSSGEHGGSATGSHPGMSGGSGMDHSGEGGGPGARHDRHGTGAASERPGRHSEHQRQITPGDPNGTSDHGGAHAVAAPPGFGGGSPDGRAVALALGLAVAIGVVGGAFLRLTAAR